MAKKAAKPKRLVRGRDYDGWAYRNEDGLFVCKIHCIRPPLSPPWLGGKYVRVKFVEVT